MLKQEDALLTGVAVAGLVTAISAIHMPMVASSRASAPDNKHIEASRRSAAVIGTVLVLGSWALAGFDPTVFVIGGSVVVALDITHRVANATDNQSGQIPSLSSAAPATPAG
jgi:hypothetical protein